MVRFFCFCALLLHAFSGCGQDGDPLFLPTTDTLLFPLGDTALPVHRSQYGAAPAPFFVHLHHNEATADSAAQHYLQRNGGVLLGLQNGRQRLVHFSLNGTRYRVDPNRIFTPEGAAQSLKFWGSPMHPAARKSIRQFADSVLAHIPDSIPIIALHNNTPGAYSLRSYLPGGPLAGDADTVFQNKQMDADDFVLTTDAALFDYLRTAGINAVLQHNTRAVDDGSLGFLFGKQNRGHTNVEAAYGHLQEQLRMISAVVQYQMGDQ